MSVLVGLGAAINRGRGEVGDQLLGPISSVGGRAAHMMSFLVITLVIAFNTEIFFTLSTLGGYSYVGSEDGVIHTVFVGTSAAAGYAAVAGALLSSRPISGRQLLIFCLPLVVTAGYLLSLATESSGSARPDYFVASMVFGVPAAITGALVAQTQSVRRLSLLLEPLMLLFTSAIVIYSIDILVFGWQIFGLGGATYQTASYLAAVAFGLNLYHILLGKNQDRWRILRTHGYRRVCLLLLPIQALGVLLSGGRGGFVLVVVYSVVLIAMSLLMRGERVGARLLSVISVAAGAGILVMPWVLKDSARGAIVDRLLAYVGPAGLNWEGTSGRDVVYLDAIDRIREAPLFGYGLFNYGPYGYPHNLFLEWLLNGGLLYFSLCFIVFILLLLKLAGLIRSAPGAAVLIPMLLYPLTMLMFSGTYLASGVLWFVMAVVFCIKYKGPSLSIEDHPNGKAGSINDVEHH